MEFRLLRSVAGQVGGERVDLGEHRIQLLLAILLFADSGAVRPEELIRGMWGEKPPSAKDKILRDIVYRARKVLAAAEPAAGDALTKVSGGYLLRVDRRHVDLMRFEDLRSQAKRLARSDPGQAALLFREALAEWGAMPVDSLPEPLPGLRGDWADKARSDLRQNYVHTVLECAEAELGVGEHNQVIVELEKLERLEPYDETVAELLMRAHHQARRNDQVHAVHRRLRKRLDEDLGTAPGQVIKDLLTRVAADDESLRRPVVEPPDAHTEEPMNSKRSAEPDREVRVLARSASQLVADVAKGTPTDCGEEFVSVVRTGFGGDTHAVGVLDRVLANPRDQKGVELLRAVFVTFLHNDTAFREEVEDLVQGERGPATGGIYAETIDSATVFNEKVVFHGDFRMGSQK
jgi:DNA-binding SARP family transcriptional activator